MTCINKYLLQVFQRSKNKEDYLSFVAKLILHVKQQARNNAEKSQVNYFSGVQCTLYMYVLYKFLYLKISRVK